MIEAIIDTLLHVDKKLAWIIATYGVASYGILFFVIFMETGFVVTPFLPGDSLLFAAGAFAAQGSFSVVYLFCLLVIAAFLGDTVNYWIGHFIGAKAFDPKFQFSVFNFQIKISKVLKPEYLHKAQAFYDKHGGKAIVLARFVPIVRTFAPFVAGVSKMHYGEFIKYNAVGGLAWVTLFLMGGFFFGTIPFVAKNFELVMVVIILISVVPMGVEWWRGKRSK